MLDKEIQNQGSGSKKPVQLKATPKLIIDLKIIDPPSSICTAKSSGEILHSGTKNSKSTTIQSTRKSAATNKSKNKTNNKLYQNSGLSMSFSNDKARQIERENCILLKQIMQQRKTTTIPRPSAPKNVTNKQTKKTKLQKTIDEQNAMLDKRILNVKSITKSFRQ